MTRLNPDQRAKIFDLAQVPDDDPEDRGVLAAYIEQLLSAAFDAGYYRGTIMNQTDPKKTDPKPWPEPRTRSTLDAATEAELLEQFTYHAPHDDQQDRYQALRAGGLVLARLFCASCRPCADRSAAIRKIREAVMTINAGIAITEAPPRP